MKFLKLLITIAGLQMAGFVSGQTAPGDREAEPAGGIESLALKVYALRFTPEQRNLLRDVRLELLFYVSDEGLARLDVVNGTYNPAIRDSLFSLNGRWPAFLPQIVNGVPKQSIYGLYITFPYESDYVYKFITPGKPLKLNDLEYYTIDNTGYDLLLGGMVNHFTGSAGSYLDTGGGFQVGFHFFTRQLISWGFSMNFYGNKLKKPYPIDDPREQHSLPSTLLIGVSTGKAFGKNHAIFDLQAAFQNVIPRSPQDDDFVQFLGASLGFNFHRAWQFSKEQLTVPYGNLSLASHHIDVHAGVRYLIYNFDEASGLMLEAGLSYRLRVKRIRNYKIKPAVRAD